MSNESYLPPIVNQSPKTTAHLVDEPNDLKLKRFEEMYSLMKDEYRAERDRFSGVGINVARLIPILALVLAMGGVGIERFLRVFRNPTSSLEWICASTYLLFWAAVSGALISFIAALFVRNIHVVRSDATMIQHFTDNRYIDVLPSLSKRYADAREQTAKQTDRKITCMTIGLCFLLGAVLLGILSLGTYVCVVP